MLSCVPLICFNLFVSHLSDIETLTTLNYKKWIRDIELALGFMDLDMRLLEAQTTVSDDGIFTKLSAKCKRSNILCLMVIKWTSLETIYGGFVYLIMLKISSGQISKESDKDEPHNLLSSFSNARYYNPSSVRTYIINMV